jgi:glyoxylase-like metal-dependent hydrolase (beta-lactamase superfamily II)
MRRRHFLAGAVPAALLTAVAPRILAREARATLTTTPLGDKLWLISGAGGNVTVLQSPAGVLLVDGGAAAHTDALLAEVRRLTGESRIHTLFNTHWHHDQTGANATLGKAGTRIIAHENTRLWLTTDVESKWERRTYQPLPKVALPTDTFYTTGGFDFGGERIEYGYLPQAHTDGDIYVHLRNANVLVAGDVAATGAFPIIDYCTNGWIGGVGDAVQALLNLANPQTQVIAGSGGVLGRAHLEAELKMLTTMRQRLSRLMAQGKSAQEMIAARPAEDLQAEWGDPALFITNSYPGMAQRSGQLGVSIV